MKNKLTISYILRCGFSVVKMEKREWCFQKYHSVYEYDLDGEIDYFVKIQKIKNKWFLLYNNKFMQVKTTDDLNFLELVEDKTKTFVYLIKSILGYKIGKTTTLDNRNAIFNVKLPFHWQFERIYVVSNHTYLERFLHDAFKNNRLNGEWFKLSGSDVKLIDNFIAQAQECL